MTRIALLDDVMPVIRARLPSGGTRGLELFCGRGAMFTRHLAAMVDTLVGVDIDQACQEDFLAATPRGVFLQGDCVEIAGSGLLGARQFDLVSVDNPLGLFGPYCEHFELLPALPALMAPGGCLVINLVTQPYDAGNPKLQPWLARRAAFYGVPDPACISPEILDRFYRQRLTALGLTLRDMIILCRETDNGVPYFHSLIASTG